MEAAYFSSMFCVLSESCEHICKCESTSSNRTPRLTWNLPTVAGPRSHPRNFGSYLEGSDLNVVNIYIFAPSPHKLRLLKRIWVCLVPRIAIWYSCRAGRPDPSVTTAGRNPDDVAYPSRCQRRNAATPCVLCVLCAKRNLALHRGGFCLCGPQVRMSCGTRAAHGGVTSKFSRIFIHGIFWLC